MNPTQYFPASAQPAPWQKKGKNDRTKNVGNWVCANCRAHLAGARLFHRPSCNSDKVHEVALVLAPLLELRGVDTTGERKTPRGTNFLDQGQIFAPTKRHARRTRAREEQMFRCQMEMMWAQSEEEVRAGHAQLLALKKQREVEEYATVGAAALPITIYCPRAGCKGINIISQALEGEVAEKVKRSAHVRFVGPQHLQEGKPRRAQATKSGYIGGRNV